MLGHVFELNNTILVAHHTKSTANAVFLFLFLFVSRIHHLLVAAKFARVPFDTVFRITFLRKQYLRHPLNDGVFRNLHMIDLV